MAASGEVLITPAAPTTAQIVTLRVENRFGSEARVGSASITRAGNAFTIEQNVDLMCTAPSNPLVVSQFEVGPLPAGTYTVTANITFTGFPPIPCSAAQPITQSATFAVIPAPSVPALSDWALLLLAAALAAAATIVIR